MSLFLPNTIRFIPIEPLSSFHLMCERCGYFESEKPSTLARAKWLAFVHQSELFSSPNEVTFFPVNDDEQKKHIVHIQKMEYVPKDECVLPPCPNYHLLGKESLDTWRKEHGVSPA